MDIRKAIDIDRGMLDGYIKRMGKTCDVAEVDALYNLAKQALDDLYSNNRKRLELIRKFAEVFK